MSTYTMNLISIEDANSAYAMAVRKARRLHERAAAVRIIAAALDGAYITRRLDARLRELFPDTRTVCVSKDSYSARKYVYMHDGACNYSDAWHIDLRAGDDNRVDGERMKQDAARDEQEAAGIEAGLIRFTEIVCQYNALATAYAGIYDELHAFFPELVYADYSRRTRR